MATSIRIPIEVERPRFVRPRLRLYVPPRAEGARRALNVVVATIGLVIAFVPMLVIAALIKLTSRGPVLFMQVRVGLDRRNEGPSGGSLFRMYKFRTMRVSHGPQRAVWARPDDDRVTPLGRVLRRYRLDELPQLWNVLLGDMNIVGPRPEQPTIFRDLSREIPEYPWRQRVRPGITGLAQVSLPPDLSVNDVRRKLAFDLEYIRRTSFWEDFRIMARTPAAMFGRRLGW